MPSTPKNLFSLLLDDAADDVADLAVAADAASSSNSHAAVRETTAKKAPAVQKKKEQERVKPHGVYDQVAPRAKPLVRSRYGGSQSQSVVTNGGSNGSSGNGLQGNRRTDGFQNNDSRGNSRVNAPKDNYKGNSNQKISNGSSGFQNKYGGDAVGNRAGYNMLRTERRGGYGGGGGGGRGRNNREEGRNNDYSNGAGNNRPFGNQQPRNYSVDRRANDRNNHSSERAVLNTARREASSNSETKDVPVPDSDGWQVVGSRRSRTYARSEASNNSETRDDLSNGGVNGRCPDGRRGRGRYHGKYREQNRIPQSDSEVIARSEASNNSEAKDDLRGIEQTGNVDVNNAADAKGDATAISSEEQTKSSPKEVKTAEEDGETRTLLLEKERREREWEEEKRKKTLQQYEKEIREKKKNLPSKEERVVALDKELESMQPVGKRMALLLPLVRKEVSESLKDAGEKNDLFSVTDKPKQHSKEDVCKSIVQVFLNPTSYQRRRVTNRASDETYPSKGNAAPGSAGKGNEVETTVVRVKTEEIKVVQIEEAEVSLKFDDPLQFPVL